MGRTFSFFLFIGAFLVLILFGLWYISHPNNNEEHFQVLNTIGDNQRTDEEWQQWNEVAKSFKNYKRYDIFFLSLAFEGKATKQDFNKPFEARFSPFPDVSYTLVLESVGVSVPEKRLPVYIMADSWVGYVKEVPESVVRMARTDDILYGKIETKDSAYFIQSVPPNGKHVEDVVIVYEMAKNSTFFPK